MHRSLEFILQTQQHMKISNWEIPLDLYARKITQVKKSDTPFFCKKARVAACPSNEQKKP